VTSREARQADSDVFRHGPQEDLDSNKRDGVEDVESPRRPEGVADVSDE
jgi:hypothetical protein